MTIDENIVKQQLTDILSDLIAIPSVFPPGDTRDLCAYAAARFEAAGFQTSVVTKTDPIANVVARIGSGSPSIAFNVHIDTVGINNRNDWQTDPFKATAKNSRVYGLGAANCKGSAAVHIWLAEEIARHGGIRTGEIVFTLVGDEEDLGPNGTDYLRASGLIKPDILIVGATTENQLITAERGILWVRITAHGKAAHAGDPGSGDNAIERMIRLLSCLQSDVFAHLAKIEEDGMASTTNIGTIRGGQNMNVVPSDCTVEIDRRLLPSEDFEASYQKIERALKNTGEPVDSYSLELLRGTNGFKGSENGDGVNSFRRVIRARTGLEARFLTPVGAYDGRYFAGDGIEIINMGPGAGSEGHASNESLPVTELLDAAMIQLSVIDDLVGLNDLS